MNEVDAGGEEGCSRREFNGSLRSTSFDFVIVY
jgi:hypothetical protein